MGNKSANILTLLEYWMSFNKNHAESYMKWAAWASDDGNEELSRVLIKLALESKRLNRLFEDAKKASRHNSAGLHGEASES